MLTIAEGMGGQASRGRGTISTPMRGTGRAELMEALDVTGAALVGHSTGGGEVARGILGGTG